MSYKSRMNPSEAHTNDSAALPAELVNVAPAAAPRLRCAERDHLIPALRLDELLPIDHQARVVWQFVQGVDLTSLYASIRAVEGGPGRPAIDPRILVALWLYATLEGVGSARALDYLCTAHHAFRWLCGGVSVNYHTLADFRVAHLEVVDALLTHSVATLRAQDLVDLNRVAQDGMRVRASAGAASFRRRPTLEQCLQQAQEGVRQRFLPFRATMLRGRDGAELAPQAFKADSRRTGVFHRMCDVLMA